MTETEYKSLIIKEIEKLGGMAVKVVTTEAGIRGTPDIIGVVNGQCFVIEAKLGYNDLSEIQKERLKEWGKAGAIIRVAVYPDMKPKDVALYVMETSRGRTKIS